MTKNKKMNKELLNKGVGTRLTADSKYQLKLLKKDTGLSYAELIRRALRVAYPTYF